jgi:short-subunit dehydrogenase
MKDNVVVIIGASSGIGKATALELARRGARVVLAARRKKCLDDLALKIKKIGGDGLSIQADVTDANALHTIAENIYQRFGRIDAWIKDAAVLVAGKFEEIPPKVFHRVFKVNFFGDVNGVRVVLPYLKKQGAGTIIDVSSLIGVIGQPYILSSTSSKFAVNEFSEALRGELRKTNIKFCKVLPSSIDTLIFHQAANFFGYKLQPLKPTYGAQKVVNKIVGLLEKPKAQSCVGSIGSILINAHKLAPNWIERIFAAPVERLHFKNEPAALTEGNVFKPLSSESDAKER